MDDEIKADMKFVEVTWTRALKVWWSLTWRALLFCFLGGLVVGIILGFIMGGVGAGASTISVVCGIAGIVVSIPIYIAIVKVVLKKRYSDFRIVLIEE